MNIVFWGGIILACGIVWLCLRPVFQSIGSTILELFHDTKDEITQDYPEDK